MSVLVIQLPPRERLGARHAGPDTAAGSAASRLPAEWGFVLSHDGSTVTSSGNAVLPLLPRADNTVLVLAEADVAWHRVDVPRAPPARQRAALLGVMEESLLDDDEALHFAFGPGAQPGQTGWVAVTHKPWLVAALAALEAAGHSVERVVTAVVPGISADQTAHGHFFTTDTQGGDAETAPWLALAQPGSAVCVRLGGALARALHTALVTPAAALLDGPSDAAAITLDGPADATATPEPVRVRWTATPAAAAAAERWLDAPVALLTEAERALEAAQSLVNLRQFDLVARHRGTRALRDVGKRFWSADWRPVRLGLVALVLVQVVGLNVYAWQQQKAIDARRADMSALLTTSYPGVRTVMNAPRQMQQETERLRAAAGRAGDGDLEALLGVAAAAWPDGQGPVQTLRFEAGSLTLAAPGWAGPQMVQFRERLQGTGFTAELAPDGRVTLARAAPVLPGAAGAAGATGTAATNGSGT